MTAFVNAAASGQPPSRPRPEPVPSTTAHAVLRGGRKLHIEHEGEVYTLQLTRQNKLLLTK